MCDSLLSQSLSSTLHLVWSRSQLFPFSACRTRSPDWNPLWSDIMLTQCEGTHVHLEVIQTFTTYCGLIGFAGLNQCVQFVLGTESLFLVSWPDHSGQAVCFYLAVVIQGMRKAHLWYLCLQTLSQVLQTQLKGTPLLWPPAPLVSLCYHKKHVCCSTISEYIGLDYSHILPLT